jgi:hypothetical protein
MPRGATDEQPPPEQVVGATIDEILYRAGVAPGLINGRQFLEGLRRLGYQVVPITGAMRVTGRDDYDRQYQERARQYRQQRPGSPGGVRHWTGG